MRHSGVPRYLEGMVYLVSVSIQFGFVDLAVCTAPKGESISPFRHAAQA